MPTASKKPRALIKKAAQRRAAFLARRPHRSFRRTKKRDYARTLELPGYFALTASVTKLAWQYRKQLLKLLAIYVVLYAVLVGIVSQDTYATLTETLNGIGGEVIEGDWSGVSTAAILLVSLVSPEASSNTGDAPQLFAALLAAMLWLSIVWFLRNQMAGHVVKVRDALYNSGAPLFAMIIIMAFIAAQALPAAIGIIAYSAAESTGLLSSGIAAMLCWFAIGGLVLLSLYWIVSSLFALVIVTLPGTYPYKALRIAGDIVTGRRARLVLRTLFAMVLVVAAWAVVMIPVIMLDMWVGSFWEPFRAVPLVPVLLVVMSAASLIWLSVYVYVLYRKVVDSAA